MVKPPRITETTKRVCLGQITGVHGVRGLLTVRSFTEAVEDIAAYGPVELGTGGKLDLTVKGAKKSGLIVKAAGVTTREAAEALKGEALYTAREHFPQTGEDEWYHADLVGLDATGLDGEPLGTVVAVENFGAGDLLEIARPGGETVYLPFTSETVPQVDIAGGRVFLDPPEGSFDITGEDGEDATQSETQ